VPSHSEDASPIEPISPPGDAVDAFDVASGWLAYSFRESRGDDGEALSVAVTDRLRVVRLADVDG
jgi:hypothetical protein